MTMDSVNSGTAKPTSKGRAKKMRGNTRMARGELG